jgi:hypothetical protein
MRILSLLIFIAGLIFSNQKTESPHGTDFKVSCKTCHSPNGWQLDTKIYSFNHNNTKMRLTGAHKTVDCKTCHPTLKFAEAKINCNDCHTDIHQGTLSPDCSRCHTTVSWLVSNITEIHRLSRFPLNGVHRTVDCSQCHRSESSARYDVSGVNCVDCHRKNYLATTKPNHMQTGISEDCLQCHPLNSFQWSGAGFDHTVFPLTLGHSALKCTDCHLTGNFKGANRECNTCHQKDLVTAKNPDHILGKFSTTCTDCHTVAPGWKPVTFNHNTFPLTLAHSGPLCIDCHKGGNYTATSKDCYSCHQADYLAATSPNHNTSGFSKNCQNCHTINPGWKPAAYNHTSFPLTLGHSVPACVDCHKGGNYSATSTVCYTCHQADYAATTKPNHVTAGIPTNCNTCHTTAPGWAPAAFSHTTFPLTLGHSTPTCTDCHKGNFTSTSTVCYSCHTTDYNNSTNPNHKTLAFSTTCTTCHTTLPGWKPATYAQHDTQMFPIYSGKHKGRWTLCTDCHTNTTNYSIFTCLTCHPKASMDSAHRGRSGYSYVSAVCYSCHPRGNAD